MSKTTIHDWTEVQVFLQPDQLHDVKYRVFRDAKKHFLEMRNAENDPIHTLELPEDMKLDKSSYEVLLRYVLLDVVAA